jgi:surface antigen
MKQIFLAAALAMAVPLAGCNTPGERVAGGALLGGATGAAIGAAAGGSRGAVTGAAIGAVGGAAVGAASAPRCAQYGYDAYGRAVCVGYYR